MVLHRTNNIRVVIIYSTSYSEILIVLLALKATSEFILGERKQNSNSCRQKESKKQKQNNNKKHGPYMISQI